MLNVVPAYNLLHYRYPAVVDITVLLTSLAALAEAEASFEDEVRELLDFNAVRQVRLDAAEVQQVGRQRIATLDARHSVRCAHVLSGVAREQLHETYKASLDDLGVRYQLERFGCLLEALFWLGIPALSLGSEMSLARMR